MPNSKKDIQTRIENLLKDNPSKSYSREEIIDLLSHELYKDKQQDVEKILGEIEVWSSMKDNQSSIYSSCKDGTVYFSMGRYSIKLRWSNIQEDSKHISKLEILLIANQGLALFLLNQEA